MPLLINKQGQAEIIVSYPSINGRSAPLPKQLEFHHALGRDDVLGVAYAGGVGSGKTMAGCIEACAMARRWPKSRGMITNNTHPQLKTSTIETFFRLFPRPYIGDYNEVEKTLTMSNGSKIIFRSTSDPDSLLGSNLLWFFMDEAALAPEYAFQTLISRLKRNEADVTFPMAAYKFWITTNPAGKNWLWKRFFGPDKRKDFVGIHAPTDENTFLDPSYITMLHEMYGEELAKRFVKGNFDTFVGQIFSEWDENFHIIDESEIPSTWYRFRSIDFGFSKPSCCLWIAEDPDGCLYVYREIYQKGLTGYDLGDMINRMSGNEEYLFTVGDTSGAKIDPTSKESIFSQLESKGIFVENAKKQDQFGRILRLKAMISRNEVFVMRNCKFLIDALPQYQWEPDSLKRGSARQAPLKINDHAVDALMYGMANRPDRYGLPKDKPDVVYKPEDRFKIAVPYDQIVSSDKSLRVYY